MQKVLLVTDHLGGGGSPVSIISLARAFSERNIDVTLVVLSDKIQHTLPDGVHVHYVPFRYRNRWQRLHRYRHHARHLEALLDSLEMDDADLVVANLYYTHQVVSQTRLAQRAWLCIRSDRASTLARETGLRRWHRHRQLRKLYHGRRVLGVSRGLIDSLKAIGVTPRDSAVIHNIIDVDNIRQRMQVPIAHSDYIVFVGRLVKSKRYDRLLRAYKVSGVSQQLLILGDGDVDDARRLIDSLDLQEHVQLLGQQENPYPYIHHARLLVLCSDYEGFGRVIAEALACDTPAVSTDCPSGPRDILVNELARGLVPVDDEAALAAAIRDLLAHPPRIDEWHYRRFSPSAIVERYLTLDARNDT